MTDSLLMTLLLAGLVSAGVAYFTVRVLRPAPKLIPLRIQAS